MAFTNPYTVDDLKRKLGAGLRLNLWLMELRLPGILSNAAAEEDISVLCKTGEFAPTRAPGDIPVPYQGDTFHVAGDKGPTEAIAFTFHLAENMQVWNVFETWLNLIQQDRTGLRTSPEIYKTDEFYMSLLNHKKEVIKKVRYIGAYPASIDKLALSQDDQTAIAEASVSMVFDFPEPQDILTTQIGQALGL